MSSPKVLPRDAFINTVFSYAKQNRNIYFISADLGAIALDQFREVLPNQFVHGGICEQNMIDVAAGLLQNDKIVFVYAMAPFVTLRCYEQIKVAIASMNLPLCIIGNGVGYSYDDAGPTHYATEDVSCMRALGGCEILTPIDTSSVNQIANHSCIQPAFRYVRLDRTFLPDVYPAHDTQVWDQGITELESGQDALILASGIMYHRAQEVKMLLKEQGVDAGLGDLFRINPILPEVLKQLTQKYPRIITLEEHFLSGGSGSAIAEAMADAGILKPLLRLGVPDQYILMNGGRSRIQQEAGIDTKSVVRRILEFIKAT